jgi:hypothetical protein
MTDLSQRTEQSKAITPEMKTRFLGFCPICEGDFKLHGDKLVHHGFTRPGVGYIIGDCLSVHELPYELSDETCRKYKAGCENALKGAQKYLARLKAGEVKTIKVPDYSKGYSRFPAMVEITIVHLAFEQAWESEVHQTEYRIRGLEREITRMVKYIEAWVLKPVRTLEEEMAAKRAGVAERKAERDAKRAVKFAKQAALKAKQADREAEKVQLMTKYKEAFQAR